MAEKPVSDKNCIIVAGVVIAIFVGAIIVCWPAIDSLGDAAVFHLNRFIATANEPNEPNEPPAIITEDVYRAAGEPVEANEAYVLNWTPTNCYGISFDFIDANVIEPYFASITNYDCQNSADIHIKVGSVEKDFTASEFFELLGFDLQRCDKTAKNE